MNSSQLEKGVIIVDVTALGTLISTVGFPVAMVLIMVYMFMKFQEDYREDIKDLRTTVENNTSALIELTAYIRKESNSEKENV